MPDTLSPQDFVAKWRKATVKERSGYQEHFIDLCRLVGHPTPIEDDPTGARFAFEAGASKQQGGQGWADVWKKGFFALEYKGKHADLKAAYQQLLQYRESLENPPLLVVSDMDTLIIHTNFTNTVKQEIPITLDDLLTADGLSRLRALFYSPDDFKAPQTPDTVTQEAARQFARLADLLRAQGAEPHAAAHFLIRLLFCLFAEDIDLLPAGLFARLVRQTRARPDAFAAQLRQLFAAMADGGWFGVDEIKHFNGGLFDDDAILPLDRNGLDLLAGITGLDWSAIEPSIFGTLFERSLDPGKRAQLGAHYTSRADILLIVEPVLMAPLRREWDDVRAKAQDLADRRAALMGKGDPTSRGQRTRLENEIRPLLLGFADRLRAVQVLDPACGSGNFLYVALKQLLDLEKAVSRFAGEIGLTPFTPGVSPQQLLGIELNEYAQQLAQATVWIGYLQWFHDNGYGFPSDPILKPLDNIRCMDAVLAYDAASRPIEPTWPPADVISGNPPFLGDKKMRAELGDTYVDDLRRLYQGRVPGGADLVTYWFEKARAMIEVGEARRAGLLATNSIRSGANRDVLHRINETGSIFMAWSDRPWILDGAAVRVAMIGFDDGREQMRQLDGRSTVRINADLTDTTDVTGAKQLEENAGICFLGMMKAGPFDIDADIAHQMVDAPLNPNGCPNTDVVKRRMGGQDVAGRPRDTWIIDFAEMTEEEASLYELPFEYVKEHIKPVREQNRRERTRRRWWLYGETRPGLRRALEHLARCIVTPEVSKHRVFVWLNTSTIPDHKLHVFARDDDYFFGVLHSKVHELWSLAQCSWMGVGNDPSYSSSRTFETFPFPWPPGREPADDPRVAAIAAAARDLVATRDAWLNPPDADPAELKKRTLTALYNARPTWLALAHARLDAAVCAAYGWPADLADDDLLARLLALNLERAAPS